MKYKLRTKGIDEQHKKLFGLINQAYDVMNSKQGVEALAPVLNGLQDYARVHFDYEERLMNQYRFPRLQIHQEEHGTFIRYIAKAQELLRDRQESVKMELVRYLKDWLTHHIQVEDRQYDRFYVDNHVTALIGKPLFYS